MAATKQKNGRRPSNGSLFWFLSVWSVVQLIVFVLVFFHVDAFLVPEQMPFAYLLLLVAYVVRKEVSRWVNRVSQRRRGDVFIVVWFAALLIMFVIEFATNGKYVVPAKMVETCMLVLIPFIATGLSKILYHVNHGQVAEA